MKRGEDTAVKRILFASDSFKGTLSAQEVCSIQKEEFQMQFPQCEMVMLPMADGGEGLVEACLSLRPGQRITCTVTGPNWVPVESGYAILEDGTAVIEMANPECAGEIRELAKNLELFEFAPKVRTPAEYGRYMIQDSGHYEYDPNLEEFYDYERYGKLRMEKETGAFTEKGYVAYCGTLTLGELMAGGPAEQHQREQEFQMGVM